MFIVLKTLCTYRLNNSSTKLDEVYLSFHRSVLQSSWLSLKPELKSRRSCLFQSFRADNRICKPVWRFYLNQTGENYFGRVWGKSFYRGNEFCYAIKPLGGRSLEAIYIRGLHFPHLLIDVLTQTILIYHPPHYFLIMFNYFGIFFCKFLLIIFRVHSLLFKCCFSN